MATLELKEPTLIRQIEQLAAVTKRPASNVLEAAVQSYFDWLEQEAIHAETGVFLAQLDELRSQYPGEHVAMIEGRVVDHDQDLAHLEERVRRRYGFLPVLIAPVTSNTRLELQWRVGNTLLLIDAPMLPRSS